MANDQQHWNSRRPRNLAMSTLPSFYPPNWPLPLPLVYHPNIDPNQSQLPPIFSNIRDLNTSDPNTQYNAMGYPNPLQPWSHDIETNAHALLPGRVLIDNPALRTEDNLGSQQLPSDEWAYLTAADPVSAGHSSDSEFTNPAFNPPASSYVPEVLFNPPPMPAAWLHAMNWQDLTAPTHQPRHPHHEHWDRGTGPFSTSDMPVMHRTNVNRLQPHQSARETSNPVRLTPDEVAQAGRRIAIPISQKLKSKKPKKPKVPPKELCVACMEQSDAHLIITLRCGCKYDHECLEGLFKAGCTSTLAFPPTCHGLPLRLNVYGSLLSKSTVKRYKEVEAEKNTKDFFYCALPTCSESLTTSMRISVKDYTYRNCHKCGESTCEKCRMLTRDHKTSKVSRRVKCRAEPAEMVAFRKLSKRNQWKQCPSCGHFIEKDEGCDHIECPCGIEFCYKVCRNFLKSSYHHSVCIHRYVSQSSWSRKSRIDVWSLNLLTLFSSQSADL